MFLSIHISDTWINLNIRQVIIYRTHADFHLRGEQWELLVLRYAGGQFMWRANEKLNNQGAVKKNLFVYCAEHFLQWCKERRVTDMQPARPQHLVTLTTVFPFLLSPEANTAWLDGAFEIEQDPALTKSLTLFPLLYILLKKS